MRRAIFVLGVIASLFGPAGAQTQSYPAPSPDPVVSGGTQTIDGVAARIEDNILTESELRELAAFQELVDGRAKPRPELIRELADQWIVRGEATATKYPLPPPEDVGSAYAQLVKKFPSPEEFKNRCARAGLTEADIRRILEQQLYLSRFLDYRFRPEAQVDDQQIEGYYKDQLTAQLKARGQAVPPLEEVEETIREVLVQRAIDTLSTKWLDETRERLQIDIVSDGVTP
jgi:hypothetical protein